MLRLRAELILAARAELAEAPQLFPSGELFWVDIPRGEINRLVNGENSQVTKYPFEVSKLLPDKSGSLALCRTGIRSLNQTFQEVGLFDFLTMESNLRLSDAAVLPDGSIAVGILDRNLAEGKGSLVQISQELEITEVVGGSTIPNGIAVLPDGEGVVWLDSPNHELAILRLNGSKLSKPERFIPLDPGLGVPDGLCVDSQGGVWVAMWGGGKVVRISPVGEMDLIVELPCPHVSSCCFDADNNLIITTASVLLSDSEKRAIPGAGGLWMLAAQHHGYQGLPIQSANLFKLFD